MQRNEDRPFADLPAALVEELLLKADAIGDALWASFSEVQEKRSQFRETLQRDGLIKHDADLGYPPIPTTCGADGAFALERLLGTDLVAVAAVAVEGLTPPSETRYWEQPHHLSYSSPLPHSSGTETIIRAIMTALELTLASQAPHDVVFLDGSLTTPLIYLNEALTTVYREPESPLGPILFDCLEPALKGYVDVLRASRSDKAWVAAPKYTSRREIGSRLPQTNQYDDRALLTLLLLPGEFTNPLALEPPREPWHLNVAAARGTSHNLEEMAGIVSSTLYQIRVFYYKPHSWIPALRLEVPAAVAENQNRLAVVLQAVKHQCATASILEPYPLYMADRMVKSISYVIPALRQAATQQMSLRYSGDLGELFVTMHGYRSESGS